MEKLSITLKGFRPDLAYSVLKEAFENCLNGAIWVQKYWWLQDWGINFSADKSTHE